MGTATATREPARDLNGVLIVFPECSVNAPDEHSIRIDSERFSTGRIITDSSVNRPSDCVCTNSLICHCKIKV